MPVRHIDTPAQWVILPYSDQRMLLSIAGIGVNTQPLLYTWAPQRLFLSILFQYRLLFLTAALASMHLWLLLSSF
jgi:hypothetical protein